MDRIKSIECKVEFQSLIEDLDILQIGVYWDQHLRRKYPGNRTKTRFSSEIGSVSNLYEGEFWAQNKDRTVSVGPSLVAVKWCDTQYKGLEFAALLDVVSLLLAEYQDLTEYVKEELCSSVVPGKVHIAIEGEYFDKLQGYSMSVLRTTEADGSTAGFRIMVSDDIKTNTTAQVFAHQTVSSPESTGVAVDNLVTVIPQTIKDSREFIQTVPRY